ERRRLRVRGELGEECLRRGDRRRPVLAPVLQRRLQLEQAGLQVAELRVLQARGEPLLALRIVAELECAPREPFERARTGTVRSRRQLPVELLRPLEVALLVAELRLLQHVAGLVAALRGRRRPLEALLCRREIAALPQHPCRDPLRAIEELPLRMAC